MKRFSIIIISLFLCLSACNPKPKELVVVNKEQEFKYIENPEKLFEGKILFENQPILEASEKLLRYFDAEITDNELHQIDITPMYKQYSILDVLNLAEKKGITLLPINTVYTPIKRALEEGKPVYAEFSIIQNNEQMAIFYGYSETELAYMDLRTGEKKFVDKIRLEEMNNFTALIPYIKSEVKTEDLEKSPYYLEIAMSDGYFRDDKEQVKKYLTVTKDNGLESEIFHYDYLTIYYHTFYDLKPEMVRPILEKELQVIRDPARLEIALHIANIDKNEDYVKEIVREIQILPILRQETLEIIIEKSIELGLNEKVQAADKILEAKTGD